MTDRELFIEVFNRDVKDSRITMRGTLVYFKGECVFNIDGYRLMYNLHRLGELMERVGCFE